VKDKNTNKAPLTQSKNYYLILHNNLNERIMKHLKSYLTILVISICITVLLYLLDSDPPYSDVWKTVFEFSIATLIIFAITTGITYLGYSVWQLLSKKKIHN
jgi:hypothetical protein